MNYADAARIKVVLRNCWFFYTEKIQEADIVIFHTCAVRQKSEDKISWKLKTLHKNQKVRISWCMVQHNIRIWKFKAKNSKCTLWNFLWSIQTTSPRILWFSNEEIKNLTSSEKTSWLVPVNNAFNPLFHNFQKKRKNIELMRRIDDTGFLPLILKKLWYDIQYDEEIINEYDKIIPENIHTSMNNHKTTAYIPISTWCNQFCSYCIVPYARWFEKHFPKEQVLHEVKIHLENGAQEIVLLGQIVNKHPEFIQILKEILPLKGLKRLRYTSPYPTFYTKELLSLHEKEEKLCPNIHMPLQSGSNKILKKMLRGYTIEEAKTCIDAIRKLKRNISITTDIIVWFPNETEEDFQHTVELIKYGDFDMIYIGIYSPRPWTLAEKEYPDTISRTIKHDRRKRLNELLKKNSEKNNKKEIWTIKKILVNKISNWIIEGYTENMKQIIILRSESLPTSRQVWILNSIQVGEFVEVKINTAIPFKLYGEII